MIVTPLFADNGFGDLKSCTTYNGAVHILPSYLCKLPGATNHHIKKDSSYVTYLKGPAERVLRGTSWIVGDLARLARKGEPLYRYRKEDEALRVILAIASKLTSEVEVRLSPLVILHHTPTPEVEEQYKLLLSGTHEILGNNTLRRFHVEARDVHLIREGDGSYFWALSKKLINYEQMVFLYDLGGKTANVAAYQNGELIEGSRFTLRQGGTYDLADMISLDPKFRQYMSGETAHIDRVMNALADGSCTYKVNGTEFSFQEIVSYHEREWLKGILADSQNRLDPWFDIHDVKLFAGGGGFRGEMAKEFLDDVVICPDFATANLQGTALSFSSAFKEELALA